MIVVDVEKRQKNLGQKLSGNEATEQGGLLRLKVCVCGWGVLSILREGRGGGGVRRHGFSGSCFTVYT